MLCNLCPRKCNVERIKRKELCDSKEIGIISNVSRGYCQMPADIYVARASLHMWEEPCISGENGSGAVFFTGCQLRCVFCQNHYIAAGKAGKRIDGDRLSEIFLELQEKRANNINLVTPTHYVPQIIRAVENARNQGLKLPIVYNTSSYENIDTLKRLEGIVNVYLPDLKYVSSEASLKYSNAADYFKVAAAAIEEMYRQVKGMRFNEQDSEDYNDMIEYGIMTRGMIVRHLLLPGLEKDSKAVIRYLHDTYGDGCYISIMNQYTPLPQVADIPELNRKITSREYDEVVDYAIDLGVVNGFIQEEGTAQESFIPEFDYEGV